jgi:uncharacterized damage-inducible protein DinB
MPDAALAEMFRHNLWATMRLLDACEKLTDEQLDTTLPGTFGSIRATLLHWLRNEDRYVSFLRGQQPNPRLTVDPFPGFEALRASAERSGSDLVEIAENLPEDPILRTKSDEGEPVELPIMTLVVQALNHATEHRTHIASLIGHQGVEPPNSDGWSYGDEVLAPRYGL